jgi:putative ABC transport system permease protein
MTYTQIIYKSAFRNKRRTILTVASIAFSLFLLTTLQTVLTEFDRNANHDTTHLRLVVRRSTSLADPLPESYLEKIRHVPHVKYVTEFTWFGGYYLEEKNFFANFATDPNTFFDVFSDITVDPHTQDIFKRERVAAIVGTKLMKRYGWKIGDKVTLKGEVYPVDLDFIIRGTYQGPDETVFFFRRDYFEEALDWKGWVGTIWLKADEPENVPSVINGIDNLFKNTSAETKTETEKQFNLDFVSMVGNVKGLITNISIVVVFTILLVCATTMSMSIREQIKEIAVLKTLGFQRHTIFSLIISEAVAITLLGGLIGCFGAKFLYQSFDIASMIMMPHFDVMPNTVLMGILVSIALGVISAAFPAYNAVRIPVTQGLKHIG